MSSRHILILISLSPALAACNGDRDREQKMILDQAAKLEALGMVYDARAAYEAAKRRAPDSALGHQAKAEEARLRRTLWGP